MSTELQLPRDEMSEKAVLGGMMIDNSYCSLVFAKLSPADFFSDPHRRIFSAIQSLSINGQKVDIVTVGSSMNKGVKFAGGYEYISSLLDGVPDKINMDEYVTSVQMAATKRRAIQICQETIAGMVGPRPDTSLLISQATTGLREALELTNQEGFQHIADIVPALKERHARIQESQIGDGVQLPGSGAGLASIITQFDRGDLHCIAARPGMGKTSLALDLGMAQAQEGYRVGIVSLEMNEYQIGTRIMSKLTGIAYKIMNEGGTYEDIGATLDHGYNSMRSLPIWLDTSASIKINVCASRCEDLVKRSSVDIIYIDYLQLFGLDDEQARKSRYLQIAVFTAQLKALAKRTDIPIVILAQLSREPEKRADANGDITYRMSDLGEGASIEHTCATIMFIHKRDNGSAYIQMGKQRNGLAGPNVRALSRLEPETMKFVPEAGEGANYHGYNEAY